MTTPTLVARPTVYEGIHMRSRMEARVAAYLDGLGWPWEYEPRAYASGGIQYLPDFEVRPWDGGPTMYLEVKGAHPTLDELDALLRRMRVIRSADPRAWLAVCSEGTISHGRFGFCGPGEDFWHERYVIRCPDHPMWVAAVQSSDDTVAPWCPACDPGREVLVKWWDALDHIMREGNL
jgi:hypothetical protein